MGNESSNLPLPQKKQQQQQQTNKLGSEEKATTTTTTTTTTIVHWGLSINFAKASGDTCHTFLPSPFFQRPARGARVPRVFRLHWRGWTLSRSSADEKTKYRAESEPGRHQIRNPRSGKLLTSVSRRPARWENMRDDSAEILFQSFCAGGS